MKNSFANLGREEIFAETPAPSAAVVSLECPASDLSLMDRAHRPDLYVDYASTDRRRWRKQIYLEARYARSVHE
jgi:hypothetical protein